MIATDHPIRLGIPPTWASAWGHDAFGPWCVLQVGDVEQTLRWIPPGDFKMGSPTTDEEALRTEFPQHWVTISRGFWMFETPCTKALWFGVMGEWRASKRIYSNSYSAIHEALGTPLHPNEPVEEVSWEDCHRFVDKLNFGFEDLNLRLPTEAEWEYACRAGINESRYGKLDDVAWYNKNSKAKTHVVKLLQANPWGLYDMLGNVWEWCEDSWRQGYNAEAAVDPFHYKTSDERRAIRGGCRSFTSQFSRAAVRVGASNPLSMLGFRCVSFAEPSPGAFGGAETSGGVSEPSRSRSDRSRE